MHKLLIFMKRRSGMSREAFRDYYENSHVPLCMHYMRGAQRYVRRYIEPSPRMVEPDYDVITELWFKDRAPVDAIIANMAKDALPADVIVDEAKLFDRAATRAYAIQECETSL